MPEVCRFYGIIIRMYHGDHFPKHFHAVYNEYKAMIDIGSLKIIQGELPPNAYNLVKKWAQQHRAEILENWEKAAKREKIKKIQPLE